MLDAGSIKGDVWHAIKQYVTEHPYFSFYYLYAKSMNNKARLVCKHAPDCKWKLMCDFSKDDGQPKRGAQVKVWFQNFRKHGDGEHRAKHGAHEIEAVAQPSAMFMALVPPLARAAHCQYKVRDRVSN